MGLLGKWNKNETEKEALAFTKILSLMACIDGDINENEAAVLGTALVDARFDLSKIGLSQKDFFNAGCEAGAVIGNENEQQLFINETAKAIKDHEKKVSLLSICAKLAQVDGNVCDGEMKLLYQIGNSLGLSVEERSAVVGTSLGRGGFLKYAELEFIMKTGI